MSISLPLVNIGENQAILVDIVIRHGLEVDLTPEECDKPRVFYLTDTKEFVVSRGDGSHENITREIMNNKNVYDILKARVDNLASLNEGSTTGDAELQDIRVGADGKTYPSAGEAVRGQVSELKGDLINKFNSENVVQTTGDSETAVMSQKAVTDEIYSKVDVTWEYGAIEGTSGNEYDSTSYSRSVEYIDIRNLWFIITKTPIMVFAYNSRHEFVGRDSATSDGNRSYEDIMAIGDDVRYIRIRSAASISPETIANLVMVLIDKHLEKTNKRFDELDEKLTEYTVTKCPIMWKQGYIDGSGFIYENNMLGSYADKIRVSDFVKAETGNGLFFRIYAYGEDGALLGYLDKVARGSTFEQTKLYKAYPEAVSMQIMVYYSSNIETPVADVEQYTSVYTTKTFAESVKTNKLFDEIDKQEYWIKQRQRFNDKPIMIAYSQGADLGYTNTELAYINAAIAGFRWLKADVQPTSDGKLVMCHDEGFTFDSDGYITAYNANSENTRIIHDMSYAECMASEYAIAYHIRTNYSDEGATKVLYRPKVCDLEKFLNVCKEFEVRPYIVIRKNHMDVVVPELLRLLEKYDFTDHCIVNSFTVESVRQVAEQSNHRVMISVVKEYMQGNALKTEEIDNLLSVSPNCTINIYTSSTTDEWNNVKLAEASKDAIAYAKTRGVVVGTAFVKEPHTLFTKGIGLMQCDILCVQPKITTIPLCVSILNGVATVERFGGYGSRYTADVEAVGAKIKLHNIRLNASDREFPDGITPNLASIFPYSLSVVGDNTTGAILNWHCDIEIRLDTSIVNLDTSTKKRIFVKFIYGM